MYPIVPPLWETLLAIDSPWFWMLYAGWLFVSDLLAPRWHRAWNAGTVGAVWMGVALSILPWHLFERGTEQTLGLWMVWLAASAGVWLCAKVLEGHHLRRGLAGGSAPGPLGGPIDTP
jgi:hypothetical protein